MALTIQCYQAVFKQRINRFLAEVTYMNQDTLCHVPNSGRLEGVLVEGAAAYIVAAPHFAKRKTMFDLLAIQQGETFITVDARLPNRVIEQALQQGILEPVKQYLNVIREYTYADSRFDFYCTSNEHLGCLIEVKSVASRAGKWAVFPDAPTSRGARHMKELAQAVTAGYRAMVIFSCQVSDAEGVAINTPLDQRFASAYKTAVEQGVEPLALRLNFSVEPGVNKTSLWASVHLGETLPICLPATQGASV